MELTRFVERHVIEENLRHYTGLSEFLDGHETTPAMKQVAANVKSMAEVQMERIHNYPFMHKVRQE